MTILRVNYLLFLMLLLFVAPLHAAIPEVSQGQIVQIKNMQSEFVPARDILVWLPADFAEDRQYAVLYMHDGDMLFDASTTWNGQEWGVDETASRLMQEGAVRDFIVVAIPNAGPDRHIEYFPQKPFEAMDPEQQAEFYALGRTDSEKLFNGPIRSDAYLRFLVEELKPYIDENFPVLGDRERIQVVLAYNTEPGVALSEQARLTFFGRVQ